MNKELIYSVLAIVLGGLLLALVDVLGAVSHNTSDIDSLDSRVTDYRSFILDNHDDIIRLQSNSECDKRIVE